MDTKTFKLLVRDLHISDGYRDDDALINDVCIVESELDADDFYDSITLYGELWCKFERQLIYEILEVATMEVEPCYCKSVADWDYMGGCRHIPDRSILDTIVSVTISESNNPNNKFGFNFYDIKNMDRKAKEPLFPFETWR